MQAKGQPLHTDEDFDNFPSDWKDIYLENSSEEDPPPDPIPSRHICVRKLIKIGHWDWDWELGLRIEIGY